MPGLNDNPFSTKYVRPGALEYLFPPGESVHALLNRLERNGWRGEIVGPHGSGKSTLLAALVPRLEVDGWKIVRFDLHDGQRWLPRGWRGELPGSRGFLIIDGYEQLTQFERWRVRRATKQRDNGLLVTAHETVGLPRLWTTEVDAARARMLLARLLPSACELVTETDLSQALENHPTDLRSALFELYDLYELRRRAAGDAS